MRSFMRYWRGSCDAATSSPVMKYLKGSYKDSSCYRALIHVPHGVFIVLSGHFISYHISWIFAFYFLSYEVIQHFIIGDGAYKDIRGALYGIVLGVLICQIQVFN